MSDLVKELREWQASWRLTSEHVIPQAADEIERLRAIVRVNGLRWGHTHAEIDELLNQQETK